MLPTQGRGYAHWYWMLPLAWLGIGGVLGQVAPIGLLLGSLFLLWLAACPYIPSGLWYSVSLLAGLALPAVRLPSLGLFALVTLGLLAPGVFGAGIGERVVLAGWWLWTALLAWRLPRRH